MRYAILDTLSGYVWWVGTADDAVAACVAADEECGGRYVLGRYVETSEREARTSESVYDVREAPSGFDVDDGTDRDEISRVEELPRVGFFRFVEDSD